MCGQFGDDLGWLVGQQQFGDVHGAPLQHLVQVILEQTGPAEDEGDLARVFAVRHLGQDRLEDVADALDGKILGDPEATDNDRFVARTLLENANVSAGLPTPWAARIRDTRGDETSL